MTRTELTIITKNDMACIFEMINEGFNTLVVAQKLGYTPETIRRGVKLAKMIGFEACR